MLSSAVGLSTQSIMNHFAFFGCYCCCCFDLYTPLCTNVNMSLYFVCLFVTIFFFMCFTLFFLFCLLWHFGSSVEPCLVAVNWICIQKTAFVPSVCRPVTALPGRQVSITEQMGKAADVTHICLLMSCGLSDLQLKQRYFSFWRVQLSK